MKARLLAAAAVLACVIMTATGCFAPPDPEPTPLFSSEEEAFAAAEATYRAYVDALNQVDLSDPETFEDVYAWTTGDANAEARKTFTQMHADRWTVSGESHPTVVVPQAIDSTETEKAQIAVCLDVSHVELKDESGNSVVSEDRPDVQSMLVAIVPSPSTPTHWAIVDFEGREGEPACV